MPFGMTATEQHAWFEYGGGQELMDKVYAKHGIKSIIASPKIGKLLGQVSANLRV
jgi:TRAP-type mannitol/chloroaromatic compound transport system substrate-binding protein